MTNSVLLQPAYILHTRAYRDTSCLIELFTLEHGCVSLVARGVRGNKARYKGLLQPFTPLLISWKGKTDLMNLNHAEANGAVLNLTGNALLCGFYLNELLVKLLHRYDAHPQLFKAYQQALHDLQYQEHQLVLRLFEKRLLSELGYALELEYEALTNKCILPDQFYYFNPNQGLFPTVDANHTDSRKQVFKGENLIALQKEKFSSPEDLRVAKRLLRIALEYLLDGKPIKSRELFF